MLTALVAATLVAPLALGGASHAQEEGDEGGTPAVDGSTPPPVSALTVAQVTAPPGCPSPVPAGAIFVGTLMQKDARTARFTIDQLRAGGGLEYFQVAGMVDVDYFDDVRYLDPGTAYLVGVAADPNTQRLVSKVRELEPRFGGNQVVALEQSTADCPVIDDPIRTLNVDGSTIESGVISPLLTDKTGVLRALLLPAAWVFAALVALATLRWFFYGAGRGAGWVARAPARRRDGGSGREGGVSPSP
jgi:hypothetical protein